MTAVVVPPRALVVLVLHERVALGEEGFGLADVTWADPAINHTSTLHRRAALAVWDRTAGPGAGAGHWWEDGEMTLTEFLLARIDEDEAASAASDDAVPGGPWSRSRRLDECAVKRRIITLAYEATGYDMTVDLERETDERSESGVAFVGDRILRALATPYAEHPDYDPRWATGT
ncbi:DUF6221 family protein [Cellulosimicrobium protaetiae]|uniref:Uncharacterized protein n=1 Tax=Cellulosimicrobium protaetiae TaxID=2587808 RepID=A0A6M5UI26_9MICO|nr:DUF6221 family protein [Cellulosimicrobium protaetiae]QJW37192.1 hypothetical protein FIC82_014355 [Cellulosimicrobium protaetiae]